MRFILSIFILVVHTSWASTVFEGDNFVLVLQGGSTYLMYPKEESLALRFSGEYTQRNDSLILTTYQYGDESIILGIYHFAATQLQALYSQATWEAYLPDDFYIQKRLYPNGVIREDYRWDDYANGNYLLYKFSPERWIRSITNYAQGQKQGKEIIFFSNELGVIKEEKNYDQGLLSGKSYRYEPLDDSFMQVKVSEIAVYKEGELKKLKTPATPPVFYTSHF